MDENEFFRQAALQILSSLDISKAIGKCFSYISPLLPVDLMSLQLYQADLASVRTVVIATKKESKAVDILTPIPPVAREFIKQNFHAGSAKIYSRSDPDPLLHAMADLFDKQFQIKRS